ncbi:putative type VI secretion system effector [Burkholderia territorii]|uniref:putative type VI secretion system effector n=1 Tax=Burkholderia territorii TaxID=1503055 RepID=UPI00075561CA|nr:putative type VI secretion system effector [Burkholderia territorii]KWA25556.1 hypothetical protein WT37_03705 [Burkholderia territorii]
MNAIATDISPTHLLHGRIQNLRKTRLNQDFFFNAADRAKMGATAIAAGLAGLGGIATGLSGMAMDTTEEADLLEFDLDGKSVRAWVWQSVFDEGDDVEVVAEQIGDIWQGYGVRRTSDKIVALHPHCSRGRRAHYKVAVSWGLKIGLSIIIVVNLLSAALATFQSINNWHAIFLMWIFGGLGVLLIAILISLRVAKRMMGFVKLAEGIFDGFGWADIKNIDLPAITKKNKRPDDPVALGVLYFRY